MYLCDQCDRSIGAISNRTDYKNVRKAKVDRHKETHKKKEDRKKIKCPYCPKIYTAESSLKHHVDSSHKKLIFQCDQCPAKLKSNQAVN
jgi:hypothetical protein